MTDRPAGETRAWKSPKPCYSKSKLVGAVAIAIDTKIFSEDGLTLDAKLEWLHSVHLLLDEVVLKFKVTQTASFTSSPNPPNTFLSSKNPTSPSNIGWKEARSTFNFFLFFSQDSSQVVIVADFWNRSICGGWEAGRVLPKFFLFGGG